MRLKIPLSRLTGEGGLLAALTLATAGLFKVAAFAREAFIASRFGLSSFTDAYFAFQQFPLTLATFMFGAFGLAFIPVYTDEKRRLGRVPWLPGLTVCAGALGILLTLLMVVIAPEILRLFHIGSAGQGVSTLTILSCSFAPVIWLGIWAGTAIADGKNVLAMFVTGLPYLMMTTLLIVLYGLGKLNTLSLPISFLAGFGLMGLGTLVRLLATERPASYVRAIVDTWKSPGLRRFLHQLTASSVENLGYSGNQVLLVYFIAHAGTGAVSASTCAMRVGMIGFSLLSQPLAQLMQAKLCTAQGDAQADVFSKWLPAISGTVLAFATLLYFLRLPIVSAVYLHGNFSSSELARVVEIVPAWLAYFVVTSFNGLMARYLFTTGQGNSYARRQLCAYTVANLIRLVLWGRLSASAIIWCSVFTEGCALLLSFRLCLRQPKPVMLSPALPTVQEV